MLCEAQLTRDTMSLEHVIAKSLGGKKRTAKALCRACNNRTGTEWDAVLEEQLRPFSLLVFPPGHLCAQKQRRVKDSEGNSVLLKAGIRGGAEHPQTRIKRKGDTLEISIVGPTRKRVAQEIRRRVRSGQLPADREEEFHQGIQLEETTTRLDMTEGGAVGGTEAWNAMFKSMVSAGITAGLTYLDMLTAVELLRGYGRGGPCLMFRESPIHPSGETSLPIWRHCAHVETDTEQREVWGYAEFYGTWCAIALLGKCYLGRPVRNTYCVNPVTGEDLSGAVQVDLTAAKALIDEMRAAPARAPDIRREQIPDPNPLLQECLRAHGVEGTMAIVGTSYSAEKPCAEVTIREMTWLDDEDDME